MDIRSLFNSLRESPPFSEESQNLLERIMELDNPVDFNEEFASDEELDRLEDELDAREQEAPAIKKFKTITISLPSKKADGDEEFI